MKDGQMPQAPHWWSGGGQLRAWHDLRMWHGGPRGGEPTCAAFLTPCPRAAPRLAPESWSRMEVIGKAVETRVLG